MVYINYTIFYTLFKYGTRVCNKRLYNYLLPDLELQHVNRINNYAIFYLIHTISMIPADSNDSTSCSQYPAYAVKISNYFIMPSLIW